jgi:hypothetical protein
MRHEEDQAGLSNGLHLCSNEVGGCSTPVGGRLSDNDDKEPGGYVSLS